MVDATSSFGTDAFNDPRDAQAGAEALQAVIHTNGALEIYAAACTESLHAPAQSPLWVENWSSSTGRNPLVATLMRGKKTVLALALDVESRGPFTIARFIGGSHANGNFPALGSNPTSALTKNAAHLLTAGIKRARPDIDLLALERQLPALGGVDNPLAALPRRESPNIALAADLSGGFEAVLGRVNAKRKRKKHRSQLNKFEAAGGFRRIKANTPEQVEWLLSAFFDMKAERFLQAGITDVFAPKAVRAALTGIFTRALEEEHPSFVLHGLEVGGKLRAVTGASRFDGRIVCDFCAFADDELSVASPGEFLFFENILEACEQEYAVYDFSVGDERYKRTWADLETRQFDVFLPLSAKGRLLAFSLSGFSRMKRTIKDTPALWRAATALRNRRAGRLHEHRQETD